MTSNSPTANGTTSVSGSSHRPFRREAATRPTGRKYELNLSVFWRRATRRAKGSRAPGVTAALQRLGALPVSGSAKEFSSQLSLGGSRP